MHVADEASVTTCGARAVPGKTLPRFGLVLGKVPLYPITGHGEIGVVQAVSGVAPFEGDTCTCSGEQNGQAL